MNTANPASGKYLREARGENFTLGSAVEYLSFMVRIPLGLAILAPTFYFAWTYPVAHVEITIGLLIYLVVLLLYPAAWLVVVPAAVPILELGFWSGRLYFTEFDLMLLVSLGGVLWRRHITLRGLNGTLAIMACILLAYNLFVTWKGVFPIYPGGLGMWNDQLSTLNGVREAKGFFAAFLMLPLMLTERHRETDIARLLAIGMILGVVTVGATVIWERLLFTGLWDFTNSYRISGLFFSTLTGGAAVDAYLMLAAPFIGALILIRPDYTKISVAGAVALLAAYSLYVTYSRANYPAVLAASAVFVIGALIISSWRTVLRPRYLIAGMAVLLAGGGVAYHLLIGTTISKRFEQSYGDMQARINHWAKAIELVGDIPGGTWTGAGRGVFPLRYYAVSVMSNKPLVAPAMKKEGPEHFISLTPGIDASGTFLRQRLTLSGDNKYRLKIKARIGSNRHEYLLVEICERNVLSFRRECLWRQVTLPKAATDWREYNLGVDLGYLGKQEYGIGPGEIVRFTRPVDISILNRGIFEKIDIASVGLYRSDGTQVLRNNDFRDGLDHWFFSYGDHLRWHVKNMVVFTYVEGGVVGLMVLALTLLTVAYRLARAILAKDAYAVLLASAITGSIFVGLFDSLFDEPRFTLLFTLLVWFSLLTPFRSGIAAASPASQSAS